MSTDKWLSISNCAIEHVASGQKLIFDYDENRVYLFRVRTAIDDRATCERILRQDLWGFHAVQLLLQSHTKLPNIELIRSRI